MTRNEVIKGLERCMGKISCNGCPLECAEGECSLSLLSETIALLKAEPKRGHWFVNSEHDRCEWACSECGYEPTIYEATPFCPNCGARMGDSE